MVFVNNKKYACATCIKGHRSSTCGHTDRPLFEIKRKGRPQTQCEHCRRLRKTKQVHVRCDCATLEDIPDGQRVRDGEVSMYPNGVADILSSNSVPAQYPTQARLENLLNPCDCNRGGACYCCTPRQTGAKRKQARQRRRDSDSPTSSTISTGASHTSGGCCGDQEMADAAVNGLFAAANGSSPECTGSGSAEEGGCGVDCSCKSSDGSCTKACCRTSAVDPTVVGSSSSGTTPRAWSTREDSVTGEAAMYAEMAMADLARGSGQTSAVMSMNGTPTATPRTSPASSSVPPYAPYVQTPHITYPTSTYPTSTEARPTVAELLADTAALVRCSCGFTCSCPGCAEHNPGTAAASYDLCPDLCTSCIDCAGGAYSLSHYMASDSSGLTPTGMNAVPSPQPQESVDDFLSRQAIAYGLPPAPPSRAGATNLSSYSGNTFVLPYSALGDNTAAARASGVGKIRKLCCAGKCACEEGKCCCAETCCGGAGEGGCSDAGHNAAAQPKNAAASANCCSSKSTAPAAPAAAGSSTSPSSSAQPPYSWPVPPSYLPSQMGIYHAHSLTFSSVQQQQQQQQQHAHNHVPFGAFQQSLAAAGLHAPTSAPPGSRSGQPRPTWRQ